MFNTSRNSFELSQKFWHYMKIIILRMIGHILKLAHFVSSNTPIHFMIQIMRWKRKYSSSIYATHVIYFQFFFDPNKLRYVDIVHLVKIIFVSKYFAASICVKSYYDISVIWHLFLIERILRIIWFPWCMLFFWLRRSFLLSWGYPGR